MKQWKVLIGLNDSNIGSIGTQVLFFLSFSISWNGFRQTWFLPDSNNIITTLTVVIDWAYRFVGGKSGQFLIDRRSVYVLKSSDITHLILYACTHTYCTQCWWWLETCYTVCIKESYISGYWKKTLGLFYFIYSLQVITQAMLRDETKSLDIFYPCWS